MATISRHRVVYLGDQPCAVDFSKLAVTGGTVVMVRVAPPASADRKTRNAVRETRNAKRVIELRSEYTSRGTGSCKH